MNYRQVNSTWQSKNVMEFICYLFSINGHVFEINAEILSMT